MDIRTICLGLLTLGEATGYDLKKQCDAGALGLGAELSFGALYPALTKLTVEGLVTCRGEAPNGRPERKVYAISEKGREAFSWALTQPLAEDKGRSPFAFAMYFADALPAERVAALIEARIAQQEKKRETLRAAFDMAAAPSQRFVCVLNLASIEAELRVLAEKRREFETQPARIARAARKQNQQQVASGT